MRRLLVDLTPLRISRPYRHLWAGALLSSIGYSISTVTVGLQVFDMTGSTFAVGVLGFVSLVPLVLLGLYGGSVIDAYDRKKVLLVTLSVTIVVAIALSILAWANATGVGLVYALVAINSGMLGVYQPARQAVVPRLIPDRLLPASVALATLSWGVAMMLGPAVAGYVVEHFGYGLAYLVQTAFCVGAFAMMFTLPPLVPEGEPRRAGLRSVAEGLAYLKKRPTLGMTFLVDLCAMVMAMPMVLFPAIGTLMIGGGATTVGILASAIAVGAFLGGVFSGRLGAINRQGRAVVVAISCWGILIAGFGVVVALSPGPPPGGGASWALWPAALLLTLAGAADTVSAVFRTTILQAATPDALRGRLQGVYTVVVSGGPHLGAVTLGALASATGEAAAAIIGGVVCVVTVLTVSLRQKGLLRYDSRRPLDVA